jgi:hypothetical protein
MTHTSKTSYTGKQAFLGPKAKSKRTIRRARENAAAPELLKALERLVDFRGHRGVFEWANDPKTSDAFDNARAAIAKVRGETK